MFASHTITVDLQQLEPREFKLLGVENKYQKKGKKRCLLCIAIHKVYSLIKFNNREVE